MTSWRLKSSLGAVIFLTLAHSAAGDDISFNRDIRPILSDRCFKCHGPDATNQDSDFRLDSFKSATADLGGYFAVVPGKVDESELHNRIHDDDDPMPPADALKPLTDTEKELLDRWIAEGARFESHWAFVPLPKAVAVPDPQASSEFADWPRGPIDQFIAKTFVKQNFQPASEAPKNKWLRRVTFDLTGLPPTRQEIADFLSDASASAKAKVVDRLLASDAYAERMTSEWLDVARYADSYGYQQDVERFVWPYRDWVINAFKQRMPYDDFITWQLAGDLLPNPTREQLLATAFNRLHSHKREGGVAVEEFRVENVADRTHTVSTAMMGLTMECCRCHDHKYDPITMKDYYSLSAFFDNIDENGLISYFTDAVPTPAMPLPDSQQQQTLDALKAKLAKAEAEWKVQVDQQSDPAFGEWLQTLRTKEMMPGKVAEIFFDETKEIINEENEESVDPNNFALVNRFGKDASSPIANHLVDGHLGKAIKLTGDDAVEIPGVGHFKRHDPFSFSLWIWSPEVQTRGVIYRRSRGWDDAGSIGYELTREGSKLSAKLCHFWPGDAIAIETTVPLEAKQWYHVVVTYDGSSRAAGLKIFLDGKLSETTVVKDHLTRNISEWGDSYEKNDQFDLAIGSRYRDRGFVGGKVDTFEVFDRQISAIEVAQLFDGHSLEELLRAPESELTQHKRACLREYYLSAIDNDARHSRKSLRAARAAVNTHMDTIPAIMVMRETAEPHQTHVLKRGVYDAKGERVTPRPPSFLPSMPDELPRDRLGLARWLTSPDHPLTARVAVNRYWQLMLGQGLVRTPEDFGNQGEIPTHPELLDWLARDFVASGWDVRGLLRQIALSATYGQTSVVSKQQRDKDPTNRYLARGTNVRLSAEMIRDNILATSGLLVRDVGGPPVKPYDLALAYTPLDVDKGDKLYRRSLYTFWKRSSPAPVMMTLNTPTRAVCRMRREITDTPLQALVLLNGPQFIEASRVMAAELLSQYGESPFEVTRDAFLRLTSREPTKQESEILVEMYQQQYQAFAKTPKLATEYLNNGDASVKSDAAPSHLAAAAVLVNSIMNLDECVRHQ
ncbi:Planctomycete cytochrome C [Planctomycetes bacterium CA13]|uniref:Planctomycete cytochrome C n=1 Tax=Novipirellula herctigrandis TaxID=2527986 RepID=A0A5C5ZAK5_9BACT|nr:Planctomycete cytochrome C [Planctomycetes bacterium CA13]